VLEVQNLSKEYPLPDGSLAVLSTINLALKPGESAAIVGPSGSGKSTLLYILGALEPPTAGTVLLDAVNPFALDEKRLAIFRNEQVGFVFQDHHLLPQCSVLENVLIPTLVAAGKERDFEAVARQLLHEVGLSQRLHHRPHALSGGERQRVAVARALICRPRVVLCDEPTGNLDHEATEMVASLLLELHRRQNTILVLVTHNQHLARRLARRYELRDTHLVEME
jgi:lipoprotein-releasing system ATP-binding protein